MLKQTKPMTDSELKEFVKTAKVVMADDSLVTSNQKNTYELLTMIGTLMEPEDKGWQEQFVESCFVSDLSTIGDFNLNESELTELSLRLGFEVKQSDYIFQTAAKMPGGSQ